MRICCKIGIQKKIPDKSKGEYLFQGQSEISRHRFDIDIKLVEEKFSTREPHFYKRPFQSNIEGQYGLTYPIFPVPIGNAKNTG